MVKTCSKRTKVRVHLHVRQTRVKCANDAKHHHFILLISPFISHQTFPGNRDAGATTVNHYVVVSVEHAIGSTTVSHFARWTSVRKTRERKKSVGGHGLGDHCWAPRCPTVQDWHPTAVRGRHVVSGQGSKWAWQRRATPRQRHSLSTQQQRFQRNSRVQIE